ncbi:MAG: hypothetical protein AAGF12_32740 [Myxococcota bacterium]
MGIVVDEDSWGEMEIEVADTPIPPPPPGIPLANARPGAREAEGKTDQTGPFRREGRPRRAPRLTPTQLTKVVPEALPTERPKRRLLPDEPVTRPQMLGARLAWLEDWPTVEGYALADAKRGNAIHSGSVTADVVHASDYVVAVADGIGKLLGMGELKLAQLSGHERATFVRRFDDHPTLYVQARRGPELSRLVGELSKL